MSTQPCAAIKFREFDPNGAPLAGGKLYTYAAGTTTPLASYTDSTGGVANANPVILDAAGRADVWLTPGVLYKFVLQDSAGVVQYTEDNFPSTQAIANTSAVAYEPGGRLTLTSGTPVTTGDVTGAGTVYYAPYKSSFVPIFDGTNWALQSIGAGLSQTTTDATRSPAAVANNSNYDVFVWSDAGTIRATRGPAWTSDTARGAGVGTTEITQVNGRWVNKNGITNGPAANLGTYVGTVRSDGSAQINDSAAKRHVWNAYGRVRRTMKVVEVTASWAYQTLTWRQARASTANQLDYVCGLLEDAVDASVLGFAQSNTALGSANVAVGVDSTTVPIALYSNGPLYGTTSSGSVVAEAELTASYVGTPGLGRHFLAWLEEGSSGGTLNWIGNSQCGIQGSVLG